MLTAPGVGFAELVLGAVAGARLYAIASARRLIAVVRPGASMVNLASNIFCPPQLWLVERVFAVVTGAEVEILGQGLAAVVVPVLQGLLGDG